VRCVEVTPCLHLQKTVNTAQQSPSRAELVTRAPHAQSWCRIEFGRVAYLCHLRIALTAFSLVAGNAVLHLNRTYALGTELRWGPSVAVVAADGAGFVPFESNTRGLTLTAGSE
jgi:hypothetical protein